MDLLLSTAVGPSFLLSLDSPQPMVVKADRQSGKTQLLCTLAAKLAVQHYKVCIVFSCKHQALSGMQRVAQLLPDAESIDNRVRPLEGGGWVHCGKKVVDDADIFMVDEIGYMDPTVFYEDLAPKLLWENPVLLIGTPTGDAHNLMARLCRLKDKKEGTHVFNVIDVTTVN